VIYAVVLRASALALLDVYGKSDQADLSAQERKAIAKLIRAIEAGSTMTTSKRKPAKTEVGQSIIRSLKEIRAWQRGELHLDVIELPDPIPPARIKALRKKAARSVRIFSERFGLPAKTVQQWEQGARRPDAASSLLLEVIDSNPEVVAAAAKRRQHAA
jgi:putative transcriptional regulator